MKADRNQSGGSVGTMCAPMPLLDFQTSRPLAQTQRLYAPSTMQSACIEISGLSEVLVAGALAYMHRHRGVIGPSDAAEPIILDETDNVHGQHNLESPPATGDPEQALPSFPNGGGRRRSPSIPTYTATSCLSRQSVSPPVRRPRYVARRDNCQDRSRTSINPDSTTTRDAEPTL
jgi:hypothetical protein